MARAVDSLLAAGLLIAWFSGAVSGPARAQSLPVDGAALDDGEFLLGIPLEADELAQSLGAIERGGLTVNLGTAAPSRESVALPNLPSAPTLSGVSSGHAKAVAVVMSDVVPRVLTSLVGSQVPTSNSNVGAAPLFAGFTFLPMPGRP